jgi:glycosyltransferase involved in cell wall biosynthesis
MKFSLILCTINRDKEIRDFLLSLSSQTYVDFELIVVDQNMDNRVLNILSDFQQLNIIYLKSKKGLSKARNIGLQKYSGDVVCFPDDDCTYPRELLENINSFFISTHYDIAMGKTIDKNTKKIVAGKNVTNSQSLKPSHILGSSTTLFIKKNKDITFDEKFGIGGIFNSEEENDLLFRMLKKGYSGYYIPEINYVYHPPSDLNYTNIDRVKERSIGLGAFIAKHLFTKEGVVYFCKYNLIRPVFGSLLYLLKLDFTKSKFYFYRFVGVWIGFIKYFRGKYAASI